MTLWHNAALLMLHLFPEQASPFRWIYRRRRLPESCQVILVWLPQVYLIIVPCRWRHQNISLWISQCPLSSQQINQHLPLSRGFLPRIWWTGWTTEEWNQYVSCAVDNRVQRYVANYLILLERDWMDSYSERCSVVKSACLVRNWPPKSNERK